MQPPHSRLVDDLGDRLADCLRASPALEVNAAIPLLDAVQALGSYVKSGYEDFGALLGLRAQLGRAHRLGALRPQDYAELQALVAELSELGDTSTPQQNAPRSEPRLRLLSLPSARARHEPRAEPPVLHHRPLELVVR